jgi:hypothetical protein
VVDAEPDGLQSDAAIVGVPHGDENEYACAADVASTSASIALAGAASATIAGTTHAAKAAL